MRQAQNSGFSLVELMISLAVASVVMAIIMSAYTAQVRSKNTHEIITDLNQAARAVLEIMVNEIRTAGLDPEGGADAQIFLADTAELIFSFDNSSNTGPANASDGDCCDVGEQVRYRLTNDANSDGVNDAIAPGVECHLGRETGPGLIAALGCGGGTSGLQPLARNVDVLNFVYLDRDGVVIPAPVPNNRLDDIRAVEVTVVARAGTQSRGFFNSFTDTQPYFNLQGQQVLPGQGDGFRRLRLATTVGCRNVGL